MPKLLVRNAQSTGREPNLDPRVQSDGVDKSIEQLDISFVGRETPLQMVDHLRFVRRGFPLRRE